MCIPFEIIFCKKKKVLKKFGPKTWCTKKPFSFWVIHHSYSLMTCPEHYIYIKVFILWN